VSARKVAIVRHITSTLKKKYENCKMLSEMGDSTSANPGSHYCINSRKRDSQPV